MEAELSRMVEDFERGRMSRRQLVAHLGAAMAMASGLGRAAAAGERPAQDGRSESTFKATNLDHIALNVTDVPRSRDFYLKHLGMTVQRDGGENNCFLNLGEDNFVALFRAERPGLSHYCYGVPGYDVVEAEATLKAEGFTPRVTQGRIYFDDPDGIEIQLAAPGRAE